MDLSVFYPHIRHYLFKYVEGHPTFVNQKRAEWPFSVTPADRPIWTGVLPHHRKMQGTEFAHYHLPLHFLFCVMVWYSIKIWYHSLGQVKILEEWQKACEGCWRSRGISGCLFLKKAKCLPLLLIYSHYTHDERQRMTSLIQIFSLEEKSSVQKFGLAVNRIKASKTARRDFRTI